MFLEAAVATALVAVGTALGAVTRWLLTREATPAASLVASLLPDGGELPDDEELDGYFDEDLTGAALEEPTDAASLFVAILPGSLGDPGSWGDWED